MHITPAGASTETFADRMAAQSLAALRSKYPHADTGRNENPMTTLINLDGINFGQLTVNELIQLTVHDPVTISVDLGPGVSFKTQGEGRANRIIFFRDDVALLPRLADVQECLVAIVAPGGKKAVHRLRGSLAGILAADPDAKASNLVANPQWEGPMHPGEFDIPDEPATGHPLNAIIGAVYWTADGTVMRSNINSAGILGRKAAYRPEA